MEVGSHFGWTVFSSLFQESNVDLSPDPRYDRVKPMCMQQEKESFITLHYITYRTDLKNAECRMSSAC